MASNTKNCDETTILLMKNEESDELLKGSEAWKKSLLQLFAVVCGLSIMVFLVLIIKWHVISQSFITPAKSNFNNGNDDYNDDRYDYRDDEDRRDDDGDNEDEDPYQRGGGGGLGATATQLGTSFSLTILAQIAWKDLTNTLLSNYNDYDYDSLAQSKDIVLNSDISYKDCDYLINYFENGNHDDNNQFNEKGCTFVDLTSFTTATCHDKVVTSEIIDKVISFFYENYKNYLFNCQISDIRMIKYISNGTQYSGLHSETHYIDGRKILNGNNNNVDYVGILFLNDNFNGGNLQFIGPKSIDIISAQKGNGLLFGAGLDYSHRVTPVTNGNRYVLRIMFNEKH